MIKDIMSKNVLNGNINSSIKDVATLMKENNIGFIPIKDKNKLLGVITDRDICLAIPTLNTINDSIEPYITNSIISISVNDTIDSALDLMSKNKIKRILVEDNNSIVGILSISDILNYSNNNNIMDTYKIIFYIHDHNLKDTPEIDEFYL